MSMFNKNRRPKVTRDIEKFDIEKDTIGQLIKENEQLREKNFLLEQQIEKQRAQVKELEDELSEMPAISKDEKIEKTDKFESVQYEHLLEQYRFEHEKYERLFQHLFLREESAAISLLEKAELADVLIESKAIGKKIIQKAEDEAKDIYLKVIDTLQELAENDEDLSKAGAEKIREKIKFLTNDFLMTNQQEG